jgi:hypothetical protein
MTTPLASEPMPGDGQVPYMTMLVNRLFHRLPEVYRTMDGGNDQWAFKRYLGAAADQAGQIDAVTDRIRGRNPVGPASPEPWALDGDRLTAWRDARQSRPSALGDPLQADAAWLVWLAQLVGAPLDPAASEMERRDTILYATSGWRAGTRQAIADAARTALTGTKFARVLPHTTTDGGGGVSTGSVWDIAIVTRAEETPDPDSVLGAILRKGAKPAGAVLHVATYGSSWDLIEALYPTWDDIEGVSWDQLEQAGITYAAPAGNVLVNPSFEVDLNHWSQQGGNATIGRVVGGLDGAGFCRVVATASGSAGIQHDGSVTTAVTPGAYLFGMSVRPDLARAVTVVANYYNGVTFLSAETQAQGTQPADAWSRVGGIFTAPATCNKIVWFVQCAGMAAAEHVDLDAGFLRRLP